MSPQPRLRVLLGEATAMGPGKAALLEAIAQSGSISKGARSMGMSYRRAWLLVETMNASFTGALVEAVRGGSGGGGARVTPLGEEILRQYREMEAEAAELLSERLARFAELMREPTATKEH